MQLQTLAKSTEVLNKVTGILNNTELSSIAVKKELEAIGKSYTTETLKAALAQSTLNKEQIEAILSANGLQGELLETTADELANAASINMVATSQIGATGSTLGLGTAFNGLKISIANATKSMLTFMTTTPVG